MNEEREVTIEEALINRLAQRVGMLTAQVEMLQLQIESLQQQRHPQDIPFEDNHEAEEWQSQPT